MSIAPPPRTILGNVIPPDPNEPRLPASNVTALDRQQKPVRMHSTWQRWVSDLHALVVACSYVAAYVALTEQDAAIAATAIPMPPQGELNVQRGVYAVRVYGRVTTPGTVSSSLGVTIRWTDGGVACSVTVPAVTGNTTATVTQSTVLVKADKGTSITYETAYASVGATGMEYSLDVIAERIPLPTEAAS